MRFFLFFVLLLLPLSAFAQSVPPLSVEGSATILHPAPGVRYLYDQHGNSSTVYHQFPGQSWFSTEDPQGRITSQGYLFDPLPAPKPLTVPPSMRDQAHERRR